MKKNLLFLLLSFFVFKQSNADTVIPQKESGSKFSIAFAGLYFEVDSARGARITSFKFNEKEILYVDFAKTDMAGSTFWPSPQSVWNWPPPANLDNKPYRSSISGEKLIFKGAIDTKSQLRFYKTMYASTQDTSVVIEYVIKNEKSTAQKWAPWEITRVPAKGLTIFARETGSVTGDMAPRTTEENGYVWYDQDFANSPGSKFFCNGKGWLAHVTSDNMLFLKKFDNIEATKAAPGEAEIEVYTVGDDSYSELENQGAYVSIPAKDSITWKVKWYARPIPASAVAVTGNQELSGFIEKILALGSGTQTPDVKISTEIRLFPNPTQGSVTVDCGASGAGKLTIDLINLRGQLMCSKTLTHASTPIDLGFLSPGCYLYHVREGNKSVSRGKLVLTR